MRTEELNYSYPEHLIATEPQSSFRILWAQPTEPNKIQPTEINKFQLFDLFRPGDILVVNDTRVLKRRVVSKKGLEILFLNQLQENENLWEVLCPARQVKDQEKIELPEGISAKIEARGLPQTIRVSTQLNEDYFNRVGQLALPPYIQKARGFRNNKSEDQSWYQTQWASEPGSFAAPTASLHFTKADLNFLKFEKKVEIAPLTLHVGLGTFLPVKAMKLEEHQMHGEVVHIPCETREKIFSAKKNGSKIWALGTTAVRALESINSDQLSEGKDGSLIGTTTIFIKPGYEFKLVDRILTNFHQPESTLLALVAAFTSLTQVLECYKYAIENNFRLFSYGDLTVWTK